ncbi:unnamed protein product [Prunus armeniaca]
MSTSSGANNTIEDEKLESQVPFPRCTRRPLPFSTSFGSERDSDDPLEAIDAVSTKLDYNSRLINSWHEKCVEDEAILADLNIRSVIHRCGRRKPPRNRAVWTVFDGISRSSFGHLRPPNRTSEVSADFRVTVPATSGQFLGRGFIALGTTRCQRILIRIMFEPRTDLAYYAISGFGTFEPLDHSQFQVKNRGKNYVWLDPSVRGLLVIYDPRLPGVSFKQVSTSHSKVEIGSGRFIRVNKGFSQKNKYLKLSHKRKLKAEELDAVMNDEIKGCLMNHMRCEEHHSELELAFNEGFEKFRAFAATTHTSYNWDYVSPDAVREILDDGGDMNEHKHVKAARKKPTDTTK